jgi:hypothetical protein
MEGSDVGDDPPMTTTAGEAERDLKLLKAHV